MSTKGPCVIAICKRKSSNWKTVTEHVISKGQTNNTLPNYVQLGDTICLNCYNGIVTRSSAIFLQHAQDNVERSEVEVENVKDLERSEVENVIDLEQSEVDNTNEIEFENIEFESTNNCLSFSKAIRVLTKILYSRENKENKPTIYPFDDFRAAMEEEDIRLKDFFDELYLSSNPQSKNVESQMRVKKQLLFVCYFLCGVRNKFVNNAKRDLSIYLDSTGVFDTTLDTLADLGITVISCSVLRCKTNASEEHAVVVDSTLAEHIKKAMVLNIDDYHSIHTERMPNTTTMSTAAHLVTILLNPITTQEAIPQANVHNHKLVDAEQIKINIENKFMTLYGLSHNKRWGFRAVDDEQKLEELNVHNYDTRLKEKHHIRSMKDVILVDLQENNLHTMEEYIDAINAVVNVPTMQQYIEKGHIIPIVADWPGQIHIRTAISSYLLYHDLSNITNNVLSFLPITVRDYTKLGITF
ncbi:hypothetical protein C2G38_2170703 [Gigaspora rosea]|uniref:Uncharacterized protein n=1 Tax=Gigaspora rosea TaxID=44941 RepID=A0A397VUF3_9GLOM|nr:hypothetical protein C2G38_2170703 [Gigaspora rosea]